MLATVARWLITIAAPIATPAITIAIATGQRLPLLGGGAAVGGGPESC
jgi:hypothetical protein